MDLSLIQLTSKIDIYQLYDLYKSCMYMPTKEKYSKVIDEFLNDNSIRIFACLHQSEAKGIIVVSFIDPCRIEILGIAVDPSVRSMGIGTYMIRALMNRFNLISVYAETDNDAVDFYRKNGFEILEFYETYNRETVVRYRCILIKSDRVSST